MKVCIHQGSHQIGGSCVEVIAQGTRLLIDLGLPLEGEAILPVETEPLPLGVLISHGHGDHFGLLRLIPRSIPVAMGPATRRIIDAASSWMRDSFLPTRGPDLNDHGAFDWGPFTIAPILVDHSAFESFAFFVQADGETLFYSGDFRGHGRTSHRLQRLIDRPPMNVDLMLMEGTSLGRLDCETRSRSESELEDAFAEAFRATKGLALVSASAQNIDRIVTLFRAASKCGRTLVIDLYTAAILEATGSSSIPRSTWKGVALYVPEKQRKQILGGKMFELLDRHQAHRIFGDELAAKTASYVLLFRSLHQVDLERLGALAGANLFYSLWEGYLDRPSGLELRRWADTRGIPLRVLHTSGHADPEDLKRLAVALNPRLLVPVHTEHPDLFKAIYSRSRILKDHEWIDITHIKGDSMTYSDLRDKLLGELEKETELEGNRIDKRNQKIKVLKEKTVETTLLFSAVETIRKRKDTRFFVNEGRVTRPSLGVELKGRNVGSITVREGKAVFETNENPSRTWDWSHDPKHGTEIRNYLDSIKDSNELTISPERHIQGQLFSALAKGQAEPAFVGLQPVLFNGYPTEVAISATKSGEIGTGNADLLVRRRDRQFLVFELKAPGKRPVSEVVEQALTYAVAFHYEANGLGQPEKERREIRKDYRSLYGSQDDKELRFGAVAIVEDTPQNQKNAQDALDRLEFPKGGDSRVDRIGVLFYAYDKATHQAKNWRWLEGHDPRRAGH